MKNEYPDRSDRRYPARRSGRWLFGMTVVILLALFVLLVIYDGRLAAQGAGHDPSGPGHSITSSIGDVLAVKPRKAASV